MAGLSRQIATTLRVSAINNMPHRFDSTVEQPFHLSVGAVFVNDEGKIAVHHFPEMWGVKDLLLLMHETLNEGETLEAGVMRGLREEFGAIGELQAFLGSVVSSFDRGGAEVQNTTAYFLVKMVSFNPESRATNDPEGHSTIEWREANELIRLMKLQGDVAPLSDESVVIERAMKFLHK
jgi:hypothetical protein